MSPAEVRMRCIEAAAKNPVPHPEGFTMGVLYAAMLWEQYILGPQPVPGSVAVAADAFEVASGKKTLGLPKKGISDLK